MCEALVGTAAVLCRSEGFFLPRLVFADVIAAGCSEPVDWIASFSRLVFEAAPPHHRRQRIRHRDAPSLHARQDQCRRSRSHHDFLRHPQNRYSSHQTPFDAVHALIVSPGLTLVQSSRSALDAIASLPPPVPPTARVVFGAALGNMVRLLL